METLHLALKQGRCLFVDWEKCWVSSYIMTCEHSVWISNKKWHHFRRTKQKWVQVVVLAKAGGKGNYFLEATSSVYVKINVTTWDSRILDAIRGRSFLMTYWIAKSSVKLQACSFPKAGVRIWWGESCRTQPQRCAVTLASASEHHQRSLINEGTVWNSW